MNITFGIKATMNHFGLWQLGRKLQAAWISIMVN